MLRTLLCAVILTVLSASSLWAASADDQFGRLCVEIWQERLQNNPLLATDTGDHQYDDQLPEVSLAAAERSRKSNEQFLRRCGKSRDPNYLRTSGSTTRFLSGSYKTIWPRPNFERS